MLTLSWALPLVGAIVLLFVGVIVILGYYLWR